MYFLGVENQIAPLRLLHSDERGWELDLTSEAGGGRSPDDDVGAGTFGTESLLLRLLLLWLRLRRGVAIRALRALAPTV